MGNCFLIHVIVKKTNSNARETFSIYLLRLYPDISMSAADDIINFNLLHSTRTITLQNFISSISQTLKETNIISKRATPMYI